MSLGQNGANLEKGMENKPTTRQWEWMHKLGLLFAHVCSLCESRMEDAGILGYYD